MWASIKNLVIQPDIAASEVGTGYSNANNNVVLIPETVGIVARCLELITDSAASVPLKVYKKAKDGSLIDNIDSKFGEFLINPNSHYDTHQFYTKIVMDLLIDGNAFIFVDKDGLYHAPAKYIEVIEDKDNYIKGYRYIVNGSSTIYPRDTVIHIRMNNSISVYRGVGRITAIAKELLIYKAMLDFQESFFLNSGMPKTILKTSNFLNKKMKARLLEEWKEANSIIHRSASGTAILDGGLELDKIVSSFKDIDFSEGVLRLEKHIAVTLGCPWSLLDAGNNVNIRNSQRLFYHHTVMPILDKIAAAMQAHMYRVTPKAKGSLFIKPDTFVIDALRPDITELASFVTTLVNSGIITPNEARAKLHMDSITGEENNKIRIPQNIAGSAVSPNIGGAPSG